MRFVALLSIFALLLAGWAAYVAWGRPAPAFVGASDPAHVGAAKAMIVGLPTPAGMTLDPYGTGCDAAGVACYTSSTVESETAFAAMTAELVASGGRVRSHVCGGSKLIEHACDAMVDYQGSGIDVLAAPTLPDNTARTVLRLSVSGVPLFQPAAAAAPYGSWASVDPLPASWTTGVTCKTQDAAGCSTFQQLIAVSPVINATLVQACATVRRVMQGRYYLINEVNSPASATQGASCGFFGHRYRTVGGKDGEILSVTARTTDASHIVVGVTLSTNQ